MKSKIYFTADLHFLHPKIVDICKRPTTIEEHDKWLLDRFNAIINKNDTLYILGDVSMGNLAKTDKLMDKLHGKKVLILGNHDNSIRNSTRFTNISQIKTFNDPEGKNIHIELCHYPLASWNRRIHGSYHLYGHVHGRFNNSGLSFDVGVDANNWEPVLYEDILQRFEDMKLTLQEDKFKCEVCDSILSITGYCSKCDHEN